MIEMYCDACGKRMYGQKYIKEYIELGNSKNVQIHAYAPNDDICRDCLILGVKKAKEAMEE